MVELYFVGALGCFLAGTSVHVLIEWWQKRAAKSKPPLTVTSLTRVDENRYKGELSDGRKWVAFRAGKASYHWFTEDAVTFLALHRIDKDAVTVIDTAVRMDVERQDDLKWAAKAKTLWEKEGEPWEPMKEPGPGLADIYRSVSAAQQLQGIQSHGSSGQLGMVSGSLGQQLAAQQYMGDKRDT